MVQRNDQNHQLDTRAQMAARLRATLNEQCRGDADASVVDELSADRRAAAAREEMSHERERQWPETNGAQPGA